MFDIGFSEFLVIGVVALVVLGPERLPRVARTAGYFFGRVQRYVNSVKTDLNRAIELEELQKMHANIQEAGQSIEQSIHAGLHDTQSQLQSAFDPYHEIEGIEPLSEEPSPQLELNLDQKSELSDASKNKQA